MVRYKNRCVCRYSDVEIALHPPSPVCRYLLVELTFGSAEDGSRALKATSPKKMQEVVRDAVLALHGDYGLACVQQSLNGTSGCNFNTHSGPVISCEQVPPPTYTHSEVHECTDTCCHHSLSSGPPQGSVGCHLHHHKNTEGSLCHQCDSCRR